MKRFSFAVIVLAALAGLAGGVRAYSLAARTPTPHVAASSHRLPPQRVRPGLVVKWAPCRKPAVLRGRACVTHVTHVVVLPPAPAPLSTAAPPTRATTAAPRPAVSSGAGGHHDDGGGGGHGGDE